MSTCDDIEVELSAYRDGELSAAQRASIESHLLDCAACKLALDEIDLVRAHLSKLPKLYAPARLRPLIDSEIASGAHAPTAAFTPINPVRRGNWAWAAGLAAALMVSMLGYVTTFQSKDAQTKDAPSAVALSMDPNEPQHKKQDRPNPAPENEKLGKADGAKEPQGKVAKSEAPDPMRARALPGPSAIVKREELRNAQDEQLAAKAKSATAAQPFSNQTLSDRAGDAALQRESRNAPLAMDKSESGELKDAKRNEYSGRRGGLAERDLTALRKEVADSAPAATAPAAPPAPVTLRPIPLPKDAARELALPQAAAPDSPKNGTRGKLNPDAPEALDRAQLDAANAQPIAPQKLGNGIQNAVPEKRKAPQPTGENAYAAPTPRSKTPPSSSPKNEVAGDGADKSKQQDSPRGTTQYYMNHVTSITLHTHDSGALLKQLHRIAADNNATLSMVENTRATPAPIELPQSVTLAVDPKNVDAVLKQLAALQTISDSQKRTEPPLDAAKPNASAATATKSAIRIDTKSTEYSKLGAAAIVRITIVIER